MTESINLTEQLKRYFGFDTFKGDTRVSGRKGGDEASA